MMRTEHIRCSTEDRLSVTIHSSNLIYFTSIEQSWHEKKRLVCKKISSASDHVYVEQVREKFLSLKKDAKPEIVVGFEEVLFVH